MIYLDVLDRVIALMKRDLVEDELVVLGKLLDRARATRYDPDGERCGRPDCAKDHTMPTADEVARDVVDAISDRPVVADSELHTSRFEAQRDTVREV